MSFSRAPSCREPPTSNIRAAPITEDITQEAMRRIAENKCKAEDAAREKAIYEQMKKIEYDALPKCAHGRISDNNALIDWVSKYGPMSAGCEGCVMEAKLRKQKLEAEKAAAEAVIAQQKRAAELAEEERRRQSQMAMMIEDKTITLKKNSAILNFVGFNGGDMKEETFYLRLDGIGKYVPVADGIRMVTHSGHAATPRSLIGEHIGVSATPTQWATHFTDGLIPFLPVCPCCHKPTRMEAARIDRMGYVAPVGWPSFEWHIDSVYCDGHYKWIAATGKHFNWKMYADKSGYNWVEWDPKDPDGSKAAEAKKLADIAAMEAQVAALQAKIADMKRV